VGLVDLVDLVDLVVAVVVEVAGTIFVAQAARVKKLLAVAVAVAVTVPRLEPRAQAGQPAIRVHPVLAHQVGRGVILPAGFRAALVATEVLLVGLVLREDRHLTGQVGLVVRLAQQGRPALPVLLDRKAMRSPATATSLGSTPERATEAYRELEVQDH
jgi:hypothetical protein